MFKLSGIINLCIAFQVPNQLVLYSSVLHWLINVKYKMKMEIQINCGRLALDCLPPEVIYDMIKLCWSSISNKLQTILINLSQFNSSLSIHFRYWQRYFLSWIRTTLLEMCPRYAPLFHACCQMKPTGKFACSNVGHPTILLFHQHYQ